MNDGYRNEYREITRTFGDVNYTISDGCYQKIKLYPIY